MTEENLFVAGVKQFHSLCGYAHSAVPSVSDADRRSLWSKLVEEEVQELQSALSSADLIRVADGLGDVIYVCIGAALAFGLPIEKIFNEIHRSNLSKVNTAGHIERRPDGKILRGNNYTPPDLLRVLTEHSGGTVEDALGGD